MVDKSHSHPGFSYDLTPIYLHTHTLPHISLAWPIPFQTMLKGFSCCTIFFWHAGLNHPGSMKLHVNDLSNEMAQKNVALDKGNVDIAFQLLL